MARNRGGALATGEILVFVDADVEVSRDALDKLIDGLKANPDVAALFGAYDESPAEQNFISQYKNLAHSYVHQSSHRDAKSFWAGIGAVRAEAFRAVGGFDERFERPSIEDIDLGYRLSQQGRRILLDPSIRGRHLKRWDLWSLVRTDVRDRAIPWTQLIIRSSLFQNDLNLRWTDRASVTVSYALLLSLVLALVSSPLFALAALGLIALLVVLNLGFYRFFAGKRGIGFAVRVVPLHLIHYLCSGFSFLVGSGIFVVKQSTASEVPGAIPPSDWRAESASPVTFTARPQFAAPSYTYGPARSPATQHSAPSPTRDAGALGRR